MAYGLIVSGLTLIAQDIPNALTGEGLKAFGATTGSHARATAYSPASFGQRAGPDPVDGSALESESSGADRAQHPTGDRRRRNSNGGVNGHAASGCVILAGERPEKRNLADASQGDRTGAASQGIVRPFEEAR